MNKVLYFEGFNEIPDKIKQFIEIGWAVYNAPRPLYGHVKWQGDFRHGIFFVAVAPEGSKEDEFGDTSTFHKKNQELDGWPCEIVTKEMVMNYGEKLAQEYNVDLSEFDYEDIVSSYANWIETHEVE